MMTQPPVPLPPLTARPGVDAFNTIVALVRNRTGLQYTETFNRVLRCDADLMRESALQPGVANFSKILNRTGLPLADNLECVVNKVSRIASEFVPAFLNYPVALQWDVIWRTALQLEQAGIPEKLYNRRATDPEVAPADWKNANACADYVFSLLSDSESNPIDRGNLPQFQSPSVNTAMVRGVFRSAIQRSMADAGLTLRQAFDKLKEDEPIFWTLAMLSYEPEK